jgi:enoyl-CoA hydratase/carnithine racemase
MNDHILVEQDGSVATVTFNRPQVRNAISLAMWAEMAEIANRLGADDNVRAILFRGAGQEAFASGADISEFKENRKDKESAVAYNKKVEEAEIAIRNCGKPTVAMIFGFCMGGGMAIALACDLRFAAEGARFELETRTLEYLKTVAANAPLSVRGAKAQLAAIFDGATSAHRDQMQNARLETFDSEDYKEGTRAFLEKRPPRFTGR